MRTKTTHKIIALTPLLLSLVIILAVFWANREMGASREMLTMVHKIVGNAFELDVVTNHYLLYPGERPKVQFRSFYGSMKSLFETIQTKTIHEQDIVKRMRQNHESIGSLFNLLVSNQEKMEAGDGAPAPELRERITGQLLALTGEIVSDSFQLSKISEKRMDAVQERVYAVIWAVALVFGVGLAMLSYLLAKRVEKANEALSGEIVERIRTEEALRQSEERFRRYFELGLIGMAITSPIKSFIEVNNEVCKILGYERGELLQKTWAELTLPEDLAADVAQFNRVMTGEIDGYTLEKRFIRKDSKVIDTTISVRALRRMNGSVDCFVVLLQDITERKRAEDTLRISEEKYRTLFESMTQGVVYQDAEGKVISANPAAEMVLGFNFGQMKGRTSGDPQWGAIHEDGSDFPGDTHPTMTSFMTGSKTKNVVMGVYNPKLGEYRWLKIDAVPQFRPGEDKPYQVYSLFDDITERRRAVEELKRSEEKFSALYSSMIEGVALHQVVYDGSGKAVDYTIIDVNPAYESITGLSRDKAIGKRASEVYGTSYPPYIDVYEKVASSRKPASFETYFDPMKKYFSISVFSSAKGEFATVFTDITERKQAEEALRQRTLELQHLTETLEDRVKERTAELAELSSQLVSIQENERKRVSYDLHDNVWQMLMAIRFGIENLFSGQEDWGALRNKSKQVMTDVLDLVGKIRSMQGDLWPYVLDDIGLGATIDWYCREFGKSHSHLIIETKNEITDREIPSSAKIVIYRILQETLSNVVKHSQASRITLHLGRKDQGTEFAVEDNGIGFDPQEAIAKRAPWGGLGLLNIKARTELSGGIFGVESAKGKGTTVRASWPL